MIGARHLSARIIITGSLGLAAAAFLFLPIAGAQVMGEYGAVVGNSAGAAASAPHADLPSIPDASTQRDSSGSTTTEVREDDSSPRDEQATDSGSNQSGDDWTQVNGSDGDN
jgi:hypothetical protein